MTLPMLDLKPSNKVSSLKALKTYYRKKNNQNSCLERKPKKMISRIFAWTSCLNLTISTSKRAKKLPSMTWFNSTRTHKIKKHNARRSTQLTHLKILKRILEFYLKLLPIFLQIVKKSFLWSWNVRSCPLLWSSIDSQKEQNHMLIKGT